MSSLLDSLNNLKNKLNSIEENLIIEKKENEPKQFDNKQILENNLKHFKHIQARKLTINVGGSIYTFAKDSIANPTIKNIFAEVDGNSFFYDGSPMLFKYIADVIRFFSDASKLKEVYKIILRQAEDEIILKAMIEQIFIDKEEFNKKIKIEREAIKERVVQVQNDNNNNNANNNNDNYNRNNAAYNYNY